MLVMKVGCCGKVLRRQWFEGVCRHPGELKPQHLSATAHLHDNEDFIDVSRCGKVFVDIYLFFGDCGYFLLIVY